jgi:crossover junction endodeoxyribonuclease RuvC
VLIEPQKAKKQPGNRGKLILGFDPGIHKCGYALIYENLEVVDYGLITTSPELPIIARLMELHNDVIGLLNAHHPDEIVCEHPFFTKSVISGSKVHRAIGIILLACGQCGYETVNMLSPTTLKAAVAWGNAEKPDIIFQVKLLFNLEGKLIDDTADAFAAVVAHIEGATTDLE